MSKTLSLKYRPLVLRSSDTTDLEALTPNHFLLGTSVFTMPSQRADNDHRERYVRLKAYSDAIWECWIRDYVPSLYCRSKSNQIEISAQLDRDFKTGDPVWIVESTGPREHLPLARSEKLNYGKDGVAHLFVPTTATEMLVHSVVKLAPVFSSNLLDTT